MRLDDYDPGDDIRDLGRGGGGFGGGGGGGLGGLLIGFLPMLLGRKMGCGTILLIGAVAFFVLGPGANMLSMGGGTADPAADSRSGANVACDTQAERFACNVFGSTHQVWGEIVSGYRKPTLNFFTDQNRSGCGAAQSAMGPFYCPADQGVYLDTAFFRELEQRFGAAGDAAQAYVIAHEVGHHIQTITGISDQVRQAQQRASQAEGNALQVRMELQADCYAGVWASRARNSAGQPVMEAGDMEEAMRAANAIGDDTLMRSAGQRPVPESFTHGTSEQRMNWLRRGLQTGDSAPVQRFRHRHLIVALSAVLAATPASAQTLYVEAGRLIDGVSNDVRTGQCITIEAERVKAVGPCGATPDGATRLDWSAYTVLPGLIDLHTHLADLGQSADLAAPIKASPAETALVGARNARVTLEAGFTSVRDVGTYRGLTDVTLRNAIERGDVPGPRMWVAGAYITIPKGGGELNGVVPNEELPPDMRLGVAATPEEAAEKTAFLLDHGADFIKTIATGAVLAIGTEPGAVELSEDYLRAVVTVAHARGKKVTAHAHGAQGIKNAINAGVDSIEHASLADEEALQLAKKHGTWLAMDIYNGTYIDEEGTKEGWPEEYLRKNRETTDTQRAAFTRAVKLGVNIGYATDAGVYPHGLNARQFRNMVKYGMTPMQAIQSATGRAAEEMGRSDVGAIVPGRYADMVAVKSDPLADITVLEKIDHVMKGGALVR